MTFIITTRQDVAEGIARRFKTRRLLANLTQRKLASRSGVSLSSLKRFEHDGQISLDSLLKVASVLSCLSDFNALAANPSRLEAAESLDAVLAKPKSRQRARGRKGSN